jgi:transposase-like protein
MKEKRRKYTREFKIEAVKMVTRNTAIYSMSFFQVTV